MTLSCRPVILSLCFAALCSSGCSSSKSPERRNWENSIEETLSAQRERFQVCGKHLPRPEPGTSLTISMTFRLNPVGALETMWLDESGKWDQRFYDCIFNVVDQMNFPSIDDNTSLEIQQSLVFRTRS